MLNAGILMVQNALYYNSVWRATDFEKTKLFYTAMCLISGWFFGGLVNICWFLYCVQVLGYGEHAPVWHISIRDMLRPAVLLLSMAVGYIIAWRNCRQACAEDGHRERGGQVRRVFSLKGRSASGD